MEGNARERASRTLFFIAVAIATGLAIAIRCYGITTQVVLDDEWHALHKLQSASYSGIFNTFGLADHSIPLTLIYKAMAETIGLAEGRLRALQVICGVALVPACAWIAWGAMRDRAVAVLLAFLVCGAPFLVFWSRFARPYSISLLFAVLCLAAIWRWNIDRTRGAAIAAALTAAIATWFHLLMGMYAALACIYVFTADLRGWERDRARALQSLRFGAFVALAIAILIASPLWKDYDALSGKAGYDYPNLVTYERMLSLFWGGLPPVAYALALGSAVWGFIVLWKRDRALAGYVAVLAITPALFLTLKGALWIHGAGTFARYQLPLQVILLFLGSIGAVDALRRVLRRSEAAVWAGTAACVIGYLALTPAIAQVMRLGTWYSHGDHHWDYRWRWIDYKRPDHSFDPPPLYRKLDQLAPGPIIEAPYVWAFPYNPMAYWATYHHHEELFGMLHDLCGSGEYYGEPPPDRRFRFRRFVFLDNPAAVKASGARYLIFVRVLRDGRAPLADCESKLKKLYGEPSEEDGMTMLWDLKAPR